MKETEFEIYDGVVVPAAALRAQKRYDKYGHIKGLPDDELADPDELERMVYKEIWWPIWSLPQQNWECSIKANTDEEGKPDYGAFATVDFERNRSSFDKLRYKVEKLKERIKDQVFMMKMASARIPGREKYEILRLVKKGLLDIGDIADNQMYFLAEMYLQAWRLRMRIEGMQEKRMEQQQQKSDAFWRKIGCV
ncbi:hypothetical protein ACFL6U_30380 [Planctomycetota bacterium]